ncbi:unnamed protein product [Gadus morhua 'NCC']
MEQDPGPSPLEDPLFISTVTQLCAVGDFTGVSPCSCCSDRLNTCLRRPSCSTCSLSSAPAGVKSGGGGRVVFNQSAESGSSLTNSCSAAGEGGGEQGGETGETAHWVNRDVGIEGSNGGEVVVALLHSVDASCDDIIAAGEILPPSLVSPSCAAARDRVLHKTIQAERCSALFNALPSEPFRGIDIGIADVGIADGDGSTRVRQLVSSGVSAWESCKEIQDGGSHVLPMRSEEEFWNAASGMAGGEGS